MNHICNRSFHRKRGGERFLRKPSQRLARGQPRWNRCSDNQAAVAMVTKCSHHTWIRPSFFPQSDKKKKSRRVSTEQRSSDHTKGEGIEAFPAIQIVFLFNVPRHICTSFLFLLLYNITFLPCSHIGAAMSASAYLF